MGEVKTKVTLVGTVLARQGTEFIYEGEAAGCETCKVKKACNNLQVGRKYRVISVRATHHECGVHYDGATAVEVMEAPITALIPADMAIVNSKIRIDLSCTRSDCPGISLCRPDGAVDGEKYIVIDLRGNPSDLCPKGKALKLVDIKPV